MRLFPMRLIKRSRDGMYYVEFDGGRRRSLRTRDGAEAKRLFAAIKREALAGRLADITGQSQVTLGQFAKEWQAWAEQVQGRATFRANRLALRKLRDVAGDSIKLDRLGKRHLDQVVADGLRAGLKPASINNYIRHARTTLNKAVEWDYIKRNPLAGVKELPTTRKPPSFLDKQQAADFIKRVADVDLRRLIVAYIATGRRRSELLALRWEQVDLDAKRYLVERSKTHLSRWYPMSSAFLAVLQHMGPQPTGRVFCRWRHPDTISHKVKAALVEAGYPNLSLHHLRHTFASLQVMQGRTLRDVQELLGHTEMRTTEIYAHLADDHLAEAVELPLGPMDLEG